MTQRKETPYCDKCGFWHQPNKAHIKFDQTHLKRGTKVKVIFSGKIVDSMYNVQDDIMQVDGYRISIKTPGRPVWYAVVPAATVTEISDNKKCFSPVESCTCSNGIGCINTPIEKKW